MRCLAALAAIFMMVGAGPALADGVGVRTFEITDKTRGDSLDAARPRQWMVDVYYPAVTNGEPAAYLDDPDLLGRLVSEQYYGQTAATLQGWARRKGAAVRSAPQSAGRPPLIVILPGMDVVRANYQLLAAAFVERGFAVAVIDLPYLGEQRLTDGRMVSVNDDPLAQSDDPLAYAPRIKDFVRDVSVTLDALPEHLSYDAAAIAVTGHSSGGAVAVDVCGADKRVSACVDWEGGIEPTRLTKDGTGTPTLIGVSRAGGKTEPPHDTAHPDLLSQNLADMARGGCTSCWVVKVTGGSHMSYSDAPEVMPDTLSRFGGVLIAPDRSFALYSGITAAFARAYAPGGGGDAAFAAEIRNDPEVTRSETTAKP